MDVREPTIVELVIAARDGQRAAFAAPYERFHRVVHAVALARVAACDASDVVQDVFTDAWHKLPRLREPAAFPGWILAIAAVIGAVAAAALAVLVVGRRGGPDCRVAGAGFAFAVDGAPAQCAGSPAARGTLPVGAWLETPGTAVADVRVADIGRLTVFGDSRVRLVGTGATGHRLELARGRVAARVTAPPRLFVVDTPAASAVDLGCAYELSVEPDGRTRLRVTSGAVSLEAHGAAAYAPMDTEVIARWRDALITRWMCAGCFDAPPR